MNKQKQGRKFNRPQNQRKAMFKALATSFFIKGKIKTTEIKAKELQPLVEKMITKAKKGNLASRRQLLCFLSSATVKKLVDKTAVDYKRRQGGYTRIIKLGPRKSDGAKMANLELVK